MFRFRPRSLKAIAMRSLFLAAGILCFSSSAPAQRKEDSVREKLKKEVLAVADAHFMGQVHGADLTWFVEQSFPRGRTRGLPVILAPTVHHGQMYTINEDIWNDDYGWKRPADFLKPIPIKLTAKQLDALWARLDDEDEFRLGRTMRNLLAGREQFLPYLQKRLRLPPRPPAKQIDQWLDDLDSDQYRVRLAVVRELERLGLVVEPELRARLLTRPPLEVRRRIDRMLQDIKVEQKRIRQAFHVLEEKEFPEGRRILDQFAKGDANLFVTREAKAALRRKNLGKK